MSDAETIACLMRENNDLRRENARLVAALEAASPVPDMRGVKLFPPPYPQEPAGARPKKPALKIV